jgi:hypothetical protein
MQTHPRDTWKKIRELSDGTSAHHKRPDQMHLRLPDGNISVTADATIKVVQPYCQKLYNRDDAFVDPTALDEIAQRPVMAELADPPSYKEFEIVISKLANNWAPGESGVTAEAIKTLLSSSLEKLHSIYHLYWTAPTVVHDEWSTAILKLLYKGKGDPANLKNYRGIVLQDYFTRLTSVIINVQLTTLLEARGLDEQSGFSPSIYAMRTALQLRREHQMPSYVLFVILSKLLILPIMTSSSPYFCDRELPRDALTSSDDSTHISSSSLPWKLLKPSSTILSVFAKEIPWRLCLLCSSCKQEWNHFNYVWMILTQI